MEIDPIQITVMAIREKLMNYYKDTCINTVIDDTNLRWTNYTYESSSRHYAIRTHQLKNPRLLLIGEHPLLYAERHPNVVTLHLGTLDRSKAMRAVRQGIEAFMGKYLRSVKVNSDNLGDKTAWREDRKLLAGNEIGAGNAQRTSGNPFPEGSQQHDYYEMYRQATVEYPNIGGLTTNTAAYESLTRNNPCITLRPIWIDDED